MQHRSRRHNSRQPGDSDNRLNDRRILHNRLQRTWCHDRWLRRNRRLNRAVTPTHGIRFRFRILPSTSSQLVKLVTDHFTALGSDPRHPEHESL